MRLLPRIERACLCLDEEGEHDHIWAIAMVWGPLVVRIPVWVDAYLIPKFTHHAFIDEDTEEVGVRFFFGWLGMFCSYSCSGLFPGVRVD